MLKTKTKRLAILFTSVALAVSCLFGLLSFQNKTDVTAKADTATDVAETLSLSNLGYAEGTDAITLHLLANGGHIKTSGFQQYWNDHGATNAALNNDVDLMENVLVDGVSMRDVVNANAEGTTSYTGTIFPFNLGGVYAPVQLMTVSASAGIESHIALRILTAFKSSFRLTFTTGFSVVTADGETLVLSEDVSFDLTESSATKVEPEKPKTDVTETLSLDYVGNVNEVSIFYMRNDGAEIGCGFAQPYWNDNGVSGTNNAASNLGVDLMEYVLVDGVSTRDLVNANVAGTTSYTGTDFPWNLGGVYSPVHVVTESGVSLIRVLDEFKTEYTVTIKAGFTLVTKDNVVFHTTEDLHYNITSGACVRAYAVTFDGENTVYVSENGVVEYPADLSETKEDDAQYSYVYNWFLNGELYDFSSPVTADVNLTSDGTFTGVLRKYTVTFNGLNAAEYAYGSTIEKPADPEKAPSVEHDYIFDGWYNGETKWNFETDTLTENTDLVAKFNETARKYLVTFDGANATEYAYGSKIEKPADPTKEPTAECDYTFNAWYNGTTEWDFDVDTVLGDVNLVANYTETKRNYTITFNVTGYDLTLEPVQVAYGTNYDLSNLLEGIDLTDYVYSISVKGVERVNVQVVADVTVDVAFTKKADVSDNASDKDDGGNIASLVGCKSVIGGGMAVVSTAVMAIAVALLKKKEQ